MAFHVKKEHIHTLPYRCAVKSMNFVSLREHVLWNWKGDNKNHRRAGLEINSATYHCDKHTYCTKIIVYFDRSAFPLAVSFSLSFFSLKCVDSKWDVFLPALGLPWQPRRKKRARRPCKLRRRPSHVFYKLRGPASQPASQPAPPQPHVRRHGHQLILLSSMSFQTETCRCSGPQTDCQWVQLQRKLM